MSDIDTVRADVAHGPGVGPLTRHAGVDEFRSLFQPGRIVTLAFGSGDPGAPSSQF